MLPAQRFTSQFCTVLSNSQVDAEWKNASGYRSQRLIKNRQVDKLPLWPNGCLRFWYLYQLNKGIPEIFLIPPLYHHEIKLQISRFGHTPQGWVNFWAW